MLHTRSLEVVLDGKQHTQVSRIRPQEKVLHEQRYQECQIFALQSAQENVPEGFPSHRLLLDLKEGHVHVALLYTLQTLWIGNDLLLMDLDVQRLSGRKRTNAL